MVKVGERLVAVVAMASLLALLAACEASTPTPTQSPATAAPATGEPTAPSASASPPPASVPPTMRPPTATASPTSAASPTAPLSPLPSQPGSAAWQPLADFPAGDAVEVAGVTYANGSFIAVGSEPAAGESVFGRRQGVVWASADGVAWRRSTPEAFENSTLLHVVGTDGMAWVLGTRSICALADDRCDDLPDAGMTVWANDGSGWRRLPQSPSLREAFVAGVLAIGDTLVAYGDRPRGAAGLRLQATVWSSADGISWDATTDLAGMDPISAAAAGPDGLAAFGTRLAAGGRRIVTLGAFSADGRSFEPVDLPAGLDIVVEAVTYGEAGFVAVGADEDAAATGEAPVVLLSADGREWQQQPLGGAFEATGVHQLRQLPEGYMLVGWRPAAGDPGRDAGFSWTSGDGREWVDEAALGGGAYRLFNGTAVGPPGAVAVALDYDDEPMDGPLTTIRVWFAPLSALAGR